MIFGQELRAAFPEAVEPVRCRRLGGRDVSGMPFCAEGRWTGESQRRMGLATGLCIEFPGPVQGPVAVGYASHFGMGGFVSERIKDNEDESMKGV